MKLAKRHALFCNSKLNRAQITADSRGFVCLQSSKPRFMRLQADYFALIFFIQNASAAQTAAANTPITKIKPLKDLVTCEDERRISVIEAETVAVIIMCHQDFERNAPIMPTIIGIGDASFTKNIARISKRLLLL